MTLNTSSPVLPSIVTTPVPVFAILNSSSPSRPLINRSVLVAVIVKMSFPWLDRISLNPLNVIGSTSIVTLPAPSPSTTQLPSNIELLTRISSPSPIKFNPPATVGVPLVPLNTTVPSTEIFSISFAKYESTNVAAMSNRNSSTGSAAASSTLTNSKCSLDVAPRSSTMKESIPPPPLSLAVPGSAA